MSFFGKSIAGLCMACMFTTAAAAAPIPVRGVVEGFYGTPWTQAQRVDIIKFCGTVGLNAYVYAPKDDPYHREKWREAYPPKKLNELSKLVKTAQKNNVKFIFAISPGLDARYSLLRGSMDRAVMADKLEAMYNIGIRDFALFFDDIKEHDGEGQSDLVNWLNENFVKKHDDVSPLIVVPTEYYFADMKDEAGYAKPYTRDFSKRIAQGVLPLFTGDGVVCDGIPETTLNEANKLYGRNLGIWWNYPVTDYLEQKLALGPVEKLPKNGDIPAIFFNPMKYEELSKIALATGAEYAMDPENYDPQAAWERAIKSQYGKLAEEMKLFSDQSQHMENSWALVGPQDGSKLRKKMDELWLSLRNREASDGHFADVNKALTELADASTVLRKRLPRRQLAGCKLQLKQLERLVKADLQALELLKHHRNGDMGKVNALKGELQEKLRIIEKEEEKAVISEKTCKAFIQEILDYVDSGKIPVDNRRTL